MARKKQEPNRVYPTFRRFMKDNNIFGKECQVNLKLASESH